MNLEIHEFQVLVPDGTGSLVLCGLTDLAAQWDDHDSLADLLMSCGIDEFDVGDGVAERVAAVARLNETGDAEAYWAKDGRPLRVHEPATSVADGMTRNERAALIAALGRGHGLDLTTDDVLRQLPEEG